MHVADAINSDIEKDVIFLAEGWWFSTGTISFVYKNLLPQYRQ